VVIYKNSTMKNSKLEFVFVLLATLIMGIFAKFYFPKFQIIPSVIFGIYISIKFTKTRLFEDIVVRLMDFLRKK
jgi:hypothetical protein